MAQSEGVLNLLPCGRATCGMHRTCAAAGLPLKRDKRQEQVWAEETVEGSAGVEPGCAAEPAYSGPSQLTSCFSLLLQGHYGLIPALTLAEVTLTWMLE